MADPRASPVDHRADAGAQVGSERGLVFFSQAAVSFTTAAERSGGHTDRDFLVARQRVRLSFATPALIGPLTHALAHLQRSTEGTADLTIRIWDSASTRSQMPPPPWEPDDHTNRGDIRGFNGGSLRTSYRPGSGDLSMVDSSKQEALYWLWDARQLPVHEIGAPLRTIFNSWFGSQQIPLVHAGAVGTAAGGVLIVGRGGSGKSTLTVASALTGMSYAADDYVLVESGDQPHIHGLYRTAKLDAEHLARLFPALHTRLDGVGWWVERKRLFLIDDHAGGNVSRGFPLRALVLPQQDAGRTLVRGVSGAQVLRALFPSTIAQLAGSGQETFAYLSAVCRSVPSYVLELGPDAIDVAPGLLRDLSETR